MVTQGDVDIAERCRNRPTVQQLLAKFVGHHHYIDKLIIQSSQNAAIDGWLIEALSATAVQVTKRCFEKNEFESLRTCH
jgi:hypothetical protein